MKELYMNGTEEDVTKVIDFIKDNDLIDKDKINMVDLLPELTEEYMEEHKIDRYPIRR